MSNEGMSQEDWVENELAVKREIIADLREKIRKEKEIFEEMNQPNEATA
jgi:hypothetical protein